MYAVPGEMPVTTPVAEPINATDVLLLLHEPPVVTLVSVLEYPWHTESVPSIGCGVGFTVITLVV